MITKGTLAQLTVIFGTFFSTIAANLDAQGSGDIIPPVIHSVLMISGEKACGTAVMTSDQQIVTAAHLAKSICSTTNCSDLKLFKSAGPGHTATQPVQFDKIILKKELAIFDLSIFEVSGISPNHSTRLTKKGPTALEPVKVFGFPKCGRLAISTGEIEEINPLQIMTTAGGLPGNSGSPLLNSKNELIGIITNTPSIWQSVLALSIGRHASLRAAPIDLIQTLARADDSTVALKQLEVLDNYYRTSVANQKAGKRLSSGLDFLSIVERLKDWIAQADVDLNNFRPLFIANTLLFSEPLKINSSKNQRLFEAAELIAAAYAIEGRAFLDNNLSLQNFDNWLLAFNQTDRSVEHKEAVETLIKGAQKSGYMGFFINALARVFWLAFPITLLLLFWSWSLGHVFASVGGTKPKRFAIMLVVAFLFWPISYLVFIFGQGKRN